MVVYFFTCVPAMANTFSPVASERNNNDHVESYTVAGVLTCICYLFKLRHGGTRMRREKVYLLWSQLYKAKMHHFKGKEFKC